MIRPAIPGAFRLVTFGCKANQYDSQRLREALVRRGWREEAEGSPELVILNTCTVTGEAGRQARQLVRRLARANPTARIAVTGCHATSDAAALRALPGVAWVLARAAEKEPAHLLSLLGHAPDPLDLGIPPGITALAGHTRAFLKIQDGCDMRCAFCIIPAVRGRNRSRPAEEIAAELRRLLASGHREIVLCGIHIGHWGRDLGARLGALVARLAAIEAEDAAGRPIDWRLRLSSIEATEVDSELLAAMARHPRRIAPHLHLPLQSGDDGVLRRMRRAYRAEQYLAASARIRAALDRPALSADVMLGFPGEDEAAFLKTLAALRAAGIARVHAFPFSPRPGTAAARPAEIGRPVAPAALRERRARLAALGAELAAHYRASLAGARETLVWEGEYGLAGRYQRVRVPAGERPSPLPDLLDVTLAIAPGAPPELVGRVLFR
ncbi:MAG: MiaB/RimO family radical SAM methylthiotransferase [Planctomycetota bacterium]